MDGMEAPLAVRFDQGSRDDKGPLGPETAHPVTQTVDSEMGGIRQPVI